MNTNRMLRFTSTARKALNNALREAQIERAASVDTRHLLIGLAGPSASNSTAAHILNGLGITPEKLGAVVSSKSAKGEVPQIPLSDGVKKTLERAVSAAQQRSDQALASAHLLVGILDDVDAAQLLEGLGAPTAHCRAALHSLQSWTDEV